MGVMGNSVAGAALALMGLAACGGGTPLLPPGGTTPGGTSGGMSGGADDAYASCKEQEKAGDATSCWKTWLKNYGNTGDSPQKDYATMYVTQHPGANPNIAETHTPTGPTTANNTGVKVIPVDPEQEKRGAPSSGSSVQWPAKTLGDKECWDHMKLTGKYVDDYNELAARCGKPTGMLPFSKPVQGELGPDNKGDVYTIKLVGGGCYRFFAVADSGIKDLDVAIATMENKVVWVDKNQQAVAIVDWDKAVCVEKDVQFKFIVALDGAGSGGYGFGIWVRPNSG